jgi:PAS domain S-box-containing protein
MSDKKPPEGSLQDSSPPTGTAKATGDLEQTNAKVDRASALLNLEHETASAASLLDILQLTRTILDASPVGIVAYDDQGDCVLASEAMGLIIGATQKQVAQQNYRELASWKKHGLKADADEVLREGTTIRREVDVVSTFGKQVSLEYYMCPFSFQGRPHLLCTCADVSERVAAARALQRHQEQLEELAAQRTATLTESYRELRQAEEKNRLLVESIPLRIFHKDYDLNYVSCNSLYARDLDLSEAADIVGRSDGDFFDASRTSQCEALDQRVRDSGLPLETEETLPLAGQELTIRIIRAPVRDGQGAITGVLGMFHDVTEQRQLEEQLRQAQKMDAIGQLAGGVAHDFNNMLAGIIGAADLLQRDLAEHPGALARLRLITDSATRAADLTQKLLSISRKSVVEPRPVDVHKPLADTIRILQHSAAPHIRMVTCFDATQSTVLGNHSQLQNALLNLGVNARDAMPGGGELSFTTANIEVAATDQAPLSGLAPGTYVELRVRDTGCGMEGSVLRHLFEPFFTTKEVGKGTGLGLSSVYGVVQDHHGFIKVESHVGEGSEFQIYLPVARPSETPLPLTEQECVEGTGHILVIDDDEAVRETARAVLAAAGYAVTVAGDGREGVRLFAQAPESFDLVLLDLVMPNLDGPGTFTALRHIAPHVPVLLSSGYSAYRGLAELVDHDAVRFLQKPYRARTLTEVVRQHLADSARPGRSVDS